MSAVLIEVMEYSPSPCQVKTVSVMAAPVNRPVRAKAKKVPMGICAVRSAWRVIALRLIRPLARAVRT